MAVHFKFRSAVGFDSVDIEASSISVYDLKRKIADHKNLSKCKDFDLIITDAETGEEYSDNNMLVPQNTNIIIKRVPAARPKTTVVLPDSESPVEASPSKSTYKDYTRWPPSLPNADSDGFDDFGIDLYAAPEPSFPELDMDESDNSVGVINKTDLGWQRQSQESHSGSQIFERGDSDRTFSRGQGFGQPIPPLGYVCHRCGVPGHFIKHCPTNVDPAYDIQRVKLPVCIPKTTSKAEWEGLHAMVDGSVAVMQPDEMTSVKGADNILPRIPNAELPSELRCSLCKTIFQEAIMIPCCQYSFCHECIRQVLIEKGKCPQCNSTKFKIDDLLPNIALRQAIERFLESQLTLSSADNCAAKPAPDGESAIQAKATSMAPSRGELQIPQSPSATVGGIEKESNQVIAESTGLSEGKKSIVDNGEGGKLSKLPKPLSHKEEEGVTMRSEATKGKKKKKPLRLSATEGGSNFTAFGKFRKGDRHCYLCGSPDHLAKDCLENSGPYPQHGMFCAGGPMYPGSIPPYGADPYWHGASVTSIRSFPNMYAPSPAAVPFETPMMPVAPYAVPPYMPSMYPGMPIHCGFMRVGNIGPAMMSPPDRPLSREEFMELQGRERWRRLMQEQHDREQIEEKVISGGGDPREHSMETQKRLHDQRRVSVDEHHIIYHKREVDRESVRNYSDEIDYPKSRIERRTIKHSRDKYTDSNAYRRQDSDDGDGDNLSLSNDSGRNLHQERCQAYSKALKSNARKDSRHHLDDHVQRSTSELEEDDLELSYSPKTCRNKHREPEYLKPSKQRGSKKRSERNIMYRESGSPSSSNVSRHRSRKGASDDQKHSISRHKNAKKYVKSKHPEEERSSYYENHTSSEEECLEGKLQEVEKHKSSHHKNHSYSMSAFDLCFSGEESKRKKYRNCQRNSQDTTRDVKSDVVDDPRLHTSRHRKRKSKSQSQPTMPIEDPIEESRWQMDAGLHIENEDVYYMYHTRDKHDHLYRKMSD